jgi:hypothetical protein
MACCGRQLYCCFVFFSVLVVLVLHTTKSWRGGYFLVVCGKDDDTMGRRCASPAAFCQQMRQAWSQEVNQKLRNDFVDIAVPYLMMGIANGDA